VKPYRPCALLEPNRLSAQFPANRRYLIAVSGGRDSVALLHQLVDFGYSKLVLSHLDHQLRGRSSCADARFVSALADRLNLRCEIGSTDVRELAGRSKLSVETAARVARFAFFVRVARQYRCRTIFLAHHADDLVETALLNLFRGASPGGLGSLRSVAIHRVGRMELTLVRPLLHIWRDDIDRYVHERGLKFREDASNVQLSSRRNRIRHRILPYIEKQFGRDVRRAIWRAAQIWSEEDALLEEMTGQNAFTAAEMDVNSVRRLPVALRRRGILRWLRAQDVAEVGFDVVERVRALTEPNARRAKVNLPRNRHARRRAGKIFLE
jgi:tRNA(Ile)-lysidine synthase